MTYIHSIILGIVEGITEFLPISSTGHLMLASHLLNLPQTNFLKTFEIAIQLGAILAVVVLYFKKVFSSKSLFWKIGTAFLPTAVIGFALYKVIKNFFFEEIRIVLWSLLIGGILIILFELYHKRHEGLIKSSELEAITYRQAFLIGLFQSLAVIPGVSRAAATIIGGLALGLSRRAIVEFSFLLAVPTMLAASGYDLYKNAPSFSNNEFGLLAIGFIVSFLMALLAIRFLMRFIRTNTFIPFGIYRIILALAFLAFLI